MDVRGPENILFESSSVNDSARKFYRLGGEGVKKKKKKKKRLIGSYWNSGLFAGGLTQSLEFSPEERSLYHSRENTHKSENFKPEVRQL